MLIPKDSKYNNKHDKITLKKLLIKFSCNLRISSQCYKLNNFSNFDHQTLKMGYQTISKRIFEKIQNMGCYPWFWKPYNFFNFDHQTTKVDYQTPPNDSIKKNRNFHSRGANFTVVVLGENILIHFSIELKLGKL